MIRPKWITFFLLLMVLPLLGCPKKVSELPPQEEVERVEGVSDSLAVDIFLDSTLSMKGFLVDGTSSTYEQTLHLLERPIGTGWKNGKNTFYRFGTSLSEIKDRGHRDAIQPGFYTDQRFTAKTHIESVIEFANVENLTVIVTDLFQDRADISLLNEKLKEKYLRKNLAIGIVGIGSQFAGTVYDVGVRNYSFPYDSRKGGETAFRPFYLLLFGKHADVARYFQELEKAGLHAFPHRHFLILSRYLQDPLSSFEGASLDSQTQIVETSGILSPKIADGEKKRFKQFRLRNRAAEATFTAVLPYAPLPNTIGFDLQKVEAEIQAWKYDGNTFVADREAAQAIKISGLSVGDSRMTLTVSVSGKQLPANSLHSFKVVIRPQEYKLPEWVSAWDMPVTMIEGWKRNPNGFNGATTFNLKPFLHDLWETIVQVHQPKIAELQFCVQND